MTRFRIKLPEEDYEEIGFHRASPKKVGQVFRLLIDPPDGEKQKQLHDQLEFGTHRCYGEDGKIYLSRHGIAEEMKWGNPTNASRKIKPLKTNRNNNNEDLSLEIDIYLLEKKKGLNNTKCWRVDKEKIAKSLISATEEHFFELSEEEKNLIEETVDEIDWSRPVLFSEKDDSVYYMLLDNFYHKLKKYRDRREEKTVDENMLNELIKKYKENSNSDSRTY